MVKRAKSPDIVEDAKYLICHHPWPHNANWEIANDYIRFCRWLACVVGRDALFAFHYKPAARGTVLIEVDRTCPNLELLLGEHRWNEILKNPTVEERRLGLEDNSSKIFYSIYPNNREAQKDGWKRVHIQNKWFDEWSPKNPFITYPYPPTHWCPVPLEDQTNKPLSRPLPGRVKPPPVKAPAPVVGSDGWVSTKMAPAPTKETMQGAWAKGTASITGNIANANANGGASTSTTAPAPAPAPAAKPASPVDFNAPKPPSPLGTNTNAPAAPPGLRPLNPAAPAWKPGTGIAPLNPAASTYKPAGMSWAARAASTPAPAPAAPAAAAAPAPVPPAPIRRAWTGAGSNLVTQPPPGLQRPSALAPTIPPHLKPLAPAPPGSSNIATLTKQFVGVSVSSSAAPAPAPSAAASSSNAHQFVGVSLSPSQEKALYLATSATSPLDDDSGELDPDALEVAVLAPWERTSSEDPTSWAIPEPVYSGNDEVADNLWGDEDTTPKGPEQVLCPTHGIVCKKGICKTMHELVKKMEREEREKERGAKRAPVAPAGAWKRGAQPAATRNGSGNRNGGDSSRASSASPGAGPSTAAGAGAAPTRGRGGPVGGGKAWGKMRSFPSP